MIPQFGSSSALPFDDFIPNFSPAKLLHGEQYLRILKPIPTGATMINQAKLVEVLDKGKAASVTFKVETKDKATGEVIFENQGTVVLRGSGGFGGKKNGAGKYMSPLRHTGLTTQTAEMPPRSTSRPSASPMPSSRRRRRSSRRQSTA